MKKRYGLLRCFPCGYGYGSGNNCLEECEAETLGEAVKIFQSRWLLLCLNDDGYSKIDDITYTVAEFYNS